MVVGRHGDVWKLTVREAPERGRANTAVVALLAETLGLPRQRVRLVAGHTGPEKVVELDGLTAADAELRLARAEGGSR